MKCRFLLLMSFTDFPDSKRYATDIPHSALAHLNARGIDAHHSQNGIIFYVDKIELKEYRKEASRLWLANTIAVNILTSNSSALNFSNISENPFVFSFDS